MAPANEGQSPPLVLVEGFLSATSSFFWGKFEQYLNQDLSLLETIAAVSKSRRVVFAYVGPVSSLHDRACELFYALKGGIVDYGEAHSREYGHSRYGRHHPEGLYPEWSAKCPLHFLGHSMGGPTITKMSALINRGFFGPQAHSDMIISVITVSALFRGTQIVYTLGERVDTAPAVRPLSVLWVRVDEIHSPILLYVSNATFFSPTPGLACRIKGAVVPRDLIHFAIITTTKVRLD